jgi:hypothetical protein
VLEAIVAAQKNNVDQNRLLAKQVKVALNFPRAHQKYIDEHGVHQLVTDCEKIIDENAQARGTIDEKD